MQEGADRRVTAPQPGQLTGEPTLFVEGGCKGQGIDPFRQQTPRELGPAGGIEHSMVRAQGAVELGPHARIAREDEDRGHREPGAAAGRG